MPKAKKAKATKKVAKSKVAKTAAVAAKAPAKNTSSACCSVNAHKLGFALALFMGGAHLFWSLLVLLRIARPIMDWILDLHMMKISYSIMPFEFFTMVALVVITFIIGYVVGWVIAEVWNWVNKK